MTNDEMDHRIRELIANVLDHARALLAGDEPMTRETLARMVRGLHAIPAPDAAYGHLATFEHPKGRMALVIHSMAGECILLLESNGDVTTLAPLARAPALLTMRQLLGPTHSEWIVTKKPFALDPIRIGAFERGI